MSRLKLRQETSRFFSINKKTQEYEALLQQRTAASGQTTHFEMSQHCKKYSHAPRRNVSVLVLSEFPSLVDQSLMCTS
eukprot:768416-Hanusia_phi.AAC.4